MEHKNENNHVLLCGTIRGEFTFSHTVLGEKFYVATIEMERLSEKVDTIPLIVSDRLLDVFQEWDGKMVYVDGEMRSYNKWHGGRNSLFLFVFGKYVSEYDFCYSENKIFLDGYICKQAKYRKTPSGREIADVMLAVNRSYRKSDYIPCICWGRNARFAESLSVGDHIRIHGRIQSREYNKRISENEYEKRTAYEVSINSMEEVIGDAEAQND